MKKAIDESNKKLKNMKMLKDDIVKEVYNYADEINDKLKKQMLDIQSTLTLALIEMQQITDFVAWSLLLNDKVNVDWPQTAKIKSIYCDTTLNT